jgi:iron-sulfur cluster repair protein YtfE (RIC family)
MTSASRWAGQAIGPLPENLFREPIDCLYADHFRLWSICDHLDRLASEDVTDPVPQIAQAVIKYLEQDLPLHIADEEDDLFPLLRIRCDPAHNIEAVVATLHDEHQNEMQLRGALVPHLRRIAAGQPPERLAAIGRRFAIIAGNIRRHLSCEESLILPLARRQLSPEDMKAIGRRMAARRGIAYPEDPAG